MDDDSPLDGPALQKAPCPSRRDVAARLLADGWKEGEDTFRPGARCFYKRFDTPTPCRQNCEREGMQVCIAVHEFENRGASRASLTLDLCGELLDGTWIGLKNWSLPQNVEGCLALIPRLLATWEFAAASTKPADHQSGDF